MKNILRARVAIIGRQLQSEWHILTSLENKESTERLLSNAMHGDSTVGKTAATQMYKTDGKNFPKLYEMTLGVDLTTKMIFIPDTNDAVELFLYDSSGQSFYADTIGKYWSQPNLYIIYYDVASQSSFEAVPKWADLVRKNISKGASQKLPGVLFANKTDLLERREITTEKGQALAEKLDLQYFEGSAKENKNLALPFDWLAREWHRMFIEKIDTFNRMN